MNEQQKHLFPIDKDGNCGIAATRDDLVDRFLMARMEAQEKQAFLDHLLYCRECNRETRRRDNLLDELQGEPVAESLQSAARALRKPAATPKFGNNFWFRAAAVIVGIVAISLVLYRATGPTPSVWAEAATVSPEEYIPQFLQSEEKNQPSWQAYNRGGALLLEGQRYSRFRNRYFFNEEKVRQAIPLLEESYRSSASEARQMDAVYLICKAHLMLDDPATALDWLEKSLEIAANRLKVERALTLCGRFQNALRQNAGNTIPNHIKNDLSQRVTALQVRLEALIAQ